MILFSFRYFSNRIAIAFSIIFEVVAVVWRLVDNFLILVYLCISVIFAVLSIFGYTPVLKTSSTSDDKVTDISLENLE